MALFTAAAFRDFYPGLVGTGEDTLLGTFIGVADALMAAWCGYPDPDSGTAGPTMVSTTYTFDADEPSDEESRRLDLPHGFVTAVSSVYVDTTWAYSTVVASSEYRLVKPRNAVFFYPTSTYNWTEYPLANRVVFVGGFTSDSPPKDVLGMGAFVVRSLLENRRSQNVVALTEGGASVTRQDAAALIPPSVAAGLARYKVWSARAG